MNGDTKSLIVVYLQKKEPEMEAKKGWKLYVILTILSSDLFLLVDIL